MKYAFDVANFGPFADPRVLADLAHRAEDAGWDGSGCMSEKRSEHCGVGISRRGG